MGPALQGEPALPSRVIGPQIRGRSELGVEMRSAMLRLLVVVLVALAGGRAHAEDAASAVELRRTLQSVWYAGEPVEFLQAIEREDLQPLFEDHEQTCRLGMYLVDAVSRANFNKKHATTWDKILARLVALVGEAPAGVDEVMEAVTSGDPMQTWARVEIQRLGVIAREKLDKSDENDWTLLGSGVETISRTERQGLWTTYGYGRAFDLSIRSLDLKVVNGFSVMASVVYLKAKMSQRARLFARNAIAIAGAYQPFAQGALAASREKPDYDTARPKLEDAMRLVADYVSADSVPISALLLHNDIVDLMEAQPGLEMEGTRITARLAAINDSLLPRDEAIEANLTLNLPLSRRWRVLEGSVGQASGLHILRTRKGELPHYEITIAALDPKGKHVVPGSSSALKGTAHRSIAAALSKAAKKRLGAGAKGVSPKKRAFHSLEGGYVYGATTSKASVEGCVVKGPTRTVVIEVTRHAPVADSVPADVAQLLKGLAVLK